MTLLLLRTAAGAILISFPGLSALRPASWARSMTRSGRMALALAVGLAVAAAAIVAILRPAIETAAHKIVSVLAG